MVTAADRLLADGKDTAAVCREPEVSEAMYHRRWASSEPAPSSTKGKLLERPTDIIPATEPGQSPETEVT